MNKLLEIGKSIGVLLLYILLPGILMEITNLKLIPYIVLIIIYIFIFKKDYLKIKEINKKTLLTGLICWVIGLILMFVTAHILEIFLGGLPQNQEAVNNSFLQNKVTMFISAVLFVPFLEETAFRLGFRKSINNKYLFVIITSLLFGYLHVFGETGLKLLYIIPYSIPGFAFAIANVKTDNIYSSIIFHMIHNAISLLLVL